MDKLIGNIEIKQLGELNTENKGNEIFKNLRDTRLFISRKEWEEFLTKFEDKFKEENIKLEEQQKIYIKRKEELEKQKEKFEAEQQEKKFEIQEKIEILNQLKGDLNQDEFQELVKNIKQQKEQKNKFDQITTRNKNSAG